MEATALSSKKVYLLDLLNECPRGQNTVNLGCPISNIRKLTSANRTIYIERMTEAQINAIINHHLDCVSRPD